MKKLLITRADDRVKQVTDLTHPMIKRYADMCGAEFMILDGNETPPMNHYRILKCYDLLKKYDRILHLDSDILIKKDCHDIFKYVDETKIGTIFEDKGSREKYRRSLIKLIQDKRDNIGWVEGYINTGVFIVSKCHREIFNVDKDNLWMDFGQDDVELGYNINKIGFEIQELSWKFNCMSMHSEPELGKHRFDASILHYAGGGWYRYMTQHRQIEQDKILLKRFGMLL